MGNRIGNLRSRSFSGDFFGWAPAPGAKEWMKTLFLQFEALQRTWLQLDDGKTKDKYTIDVLFVLFVFPIAHQILKEKSDFSDTKPYYHSKK